VARFSKRPNIVKGAAAGALAGFAASWAMNLAAKLYARVTLPHETDPEIRRIRLRERELLCIERADPTGEGAERMAERFLRRELTDRELNLARDLLHYAFGIGAGAVYGLLAERNRNITRIYGLYFAALLLIGGEEIATPALGLLPPPHKLPAAAHFAMASSHVVYGITLEATRRAARAALDQTPWPALAKSA
jgi:putative membrane protein